MTFWKCLVNLIFAGLRMAIFDNFFVFVQQRGSKGMCYFIVHYSSHCLFMTPISFLSFKRSFFGFHSRWREIWPFSCQTFFMQEAYLKFYDNKNSFQPTFSVYKLQWNTLNIVIFGNVKSVWYLLSDGNLWKWTIWIVNGFLCHWLNFSHFYIHF